MSDHVLDLVVLILFRIQIPVVVRNQGIEFIFEQNDKEILYLIGVFNEFMSGQKLQVRGHVKDSVDSVDDSFIGNFGDYFLERGEQNLNLLETYAPAKNVD